MTKDVHSDSSFRVRFTKGYELIKNHPNHVPVLFCPSKDITLEKDSIMCHRNATLSHVIMQFRRNLKTEDHSPATGYIFYILTEEGKEVLPRMTESIGELHSRYHQSDMWLNIKVDKEVIFG